MINNPGGDPAGDTPYVFFIVYCNFIALHFLYGLSQLMPYPVVCARTFQSA